MKKKLIYITLLFVLMLTIITLFFTQNSKMENNNLDKGRQLIYINEIEKEIENSNVNNQSLNRSINSLKDEINNVNINKENNNKEIYEYFSLLLFILIIFGYAYFVIVRPFERMEEFAEEIGRGNFNIKINYEKNNLFGAFTWAFDHMKKEIIKARSCEKEAIDNNKTVIATLSHDIKTPVASIRAYAEALEANLDHNVERREKYIKVIMKKCDEVAKLTNDLFLHSLSDLDMLKINTEKAEISMIINDCLNDLLGEDKNISIIGNLPKAILNIDVKRFNQVLENIINNASKYAKDSPIEIKAEINKENYYLYIKDFGPGILDKDMPFVFNKFYRGSNVMDKQGAGLGLYIVKYIMNQLKGDVEIFNKGGLMVKLWLPLDSTS
ncbi:MAG: HAMP domain-containing histidine kinase [Clostridiales bacterium]|nr:HAMP domain-containing histidine kinase [Clostridiales bacterium]